MRVDNLASLGAGGRIDADLAIIGGGPSGLTIARQFSGLPVQVVVLESGEKEESTRFSDLNAVESVGEPRTEAQVRKRREFHGANATSWSHEIQGFGVRCRVLGGSSHAWAGKSAAFDDIDFEARDWAKYSGWPINRATLAPYLDRAADALNLGPNIYDEALWELIGAEAPEPRPDPKVLASFFWQFARSRIDKLDLMRFGPEFLTLDSPNVRVLVNATVIRIDTDETGRRVEGLELSTIDGARSRVAARAVVLAASGIENPRLLLASNRTHPAGIGNVDDLVGRFLMDHPGARLGRFTGKDVTAMADRFGFYGVSHNGRAHMYMHGLAPTAEVQRRERLLHCAAYMMGEHAPDNPWDALKRLLRGKSDKPLADVATVAGSPGLVAKGLGMKMLESPAVPLALKDVVINTVIRRNANFVAREFQSRGLPHKLTGLVIDGITEQPPDPESRITLSNRTDPLGVPLARVDWRIGEDALSSLIQLGKLIASEFARAGLPAPILEDWVAQERPQDAVIIDMAHTLGTTRMADDPKRGVVDADCAVHGVAGLYVAGGSVFPTSGHVNPTLMILALAIRLADHLKVRLATQVPAERVS